MSKIVGQKRENNRLSCQEYSNKIIWEIVWIIISSGLLMSVVWLNWFYHDLYQSKLHHKGGVRHETSLMNKKVPFIPVRAYVAFWLFPIMLTLQSYRLFQKLCPHISPIPSSGSLPDHTPHEEKWSGEPSWISWAYHTLLRQCHLATLKHFAANPLKKGMDTQVEVKKKLL